MKINLTTKSIKWKRSRFDRSMRRDVKQKKNGHGEYHSEFLVGSPNADLASTILVM